MKTILCPHCGMENSGDAIYCVVCNQELDSTLQSEDIRNPTVNLKEKNDHSEIPSSARRETGSREEIITPTESNSSGEKPSRLKFILSGKSKEPDLKPIQKEGLFPTLGKAEDSPNIAPKSKTPFLDSEDFPTNISGNTLPDWLRSAEFFQAEEQTGAGEGISHADLDASLGEIPEWVRKLQVNADKRSTKTPLEHQQPPSSEDQDSPPIGVEIPTTTHLTSAIPIEVSDPGLPGVVKTYLNSLKAPRKLIPERSSRLSRLSWGIIGLAMISLMAALIWSGSSVSVSTEPARPETIIMDSFIGSISPESVVLVALEYDLSLAGELENAALPVLAQLMSKQANLVFISTRPVGPAMSRHLVDRGLSWQPEFPGEKIFIFPFLPGSASGLLLFAISPSEAFPVGVNGEELWLSPALATMHKASDFTLLLLLTDSSEAGKDWLEMVQPRLGQTPLFVIASSQAAPVLRPYLESGQIKALVEGISGAASYERVHLLTTNNQLLLRAYRVGLLSMAIFLACVILLSIINPDLLISSQGKRRRHASK
jgi:hypothetical protein